MASRIEHRAAFTQPAAAVHATFVDPEYLAARLRELGGQGAELLDRTADGGTTTIELRQGVPADKLPSGAKALVKGDLVVHRTEAWWPSATGVAGETSAEVSGVPGSVKGAFGLVDSGSGSTWTTDGEVRVRIPLIGGKLESVIAEQVRKLLAAEAEFAAAWLAGRA